MKAPIKFLLFNTIISSLLSFSINKGLCASETGWALTQHSKLFGDQYVYLNTRGVKCLNTKQGIGWVTESPNWNITFFNNKTKLYYTLTAESWKKKIGKNGLTPSNISWSKIKSGSIAGLKASEYQMTNSPTSTNSNSKWLSATYWLADSINVPASLSQLISAASGLPASNSIPLQLSYRNQSGQTENLLSTSQQQSAIIPDSYFYVPTNYTLAKSEVEVLISQENRSLLNDLANDFSQSSPHNGSNTQSNNLAKQANLSLDKLPDQLSLPSGKTINKEQINKFLKNLR